MVEYSPEALNAARTKAKLSRRELALEAGISALTIFRYEKGVTSPTFRKWEALMGALERVKPNAAKTKKVAKKA